MDALPHQHVKDPPSSPSSIAPTVAVIHLSALAHNLSCVRRCIPPGCEMIAVVKANAYGHGAVPIAQALLHLGVSRLGVATLSEGLALRDASVSAPILVMGPLLAKEYPEAIARGLTPLVYDADQAVALGECLKHRPAPCQIHLKVDTGMGRLGLSPDQVSSILQSPPFEKILQVEGMMTHLADADNPDPAFTRLQLDRFHSVVRQIESLGLRIPLVHAANSAAILSHPSSHFTAVRPGIMLYGYHTLQGNHDRPDLKPVLTLSTTVAHVRSLSRGESLSYNRTFIAPRSCRIAVLPVGYADGYNRLLSNRGAVLIHGQRASIVGRVCMDQTMVDVTDIPGVQPGDEAVLIGTQGTNRITADDLAHWQGSIPYEVLCAIGPRVPRIYHRLDSTP